MERFVKKYSLGVSAFISALVGITIDGDIQNSVTVTIWAMIRALRTISPSIPHAEVQTKTFWANLRLDRHHVPLLRSNFVNLVVSSPRVACNLQKVP